MNTTNAPRGDDTRHFPISHRTNMPEGLLIFDNVFVPNERVFLDGETSHAASLAHALGLWERTNAVAYSGSSADRLVGLAALLAEMNGAGERADIRDLLVGDGDLRHDVPRRMGSRDEERDDQRRRQRCHPPRSTSARRSTTTPSSTGR